MQKTPFRFHRGGPRHKLEPMAENNETPTVTIEVEMADSSEEPEGSFESVIKVRITGSERHACELVKEAVLLAIQAALGDDAPKDNHLPCPCIASTRPFVADCGVV